MKNTLKTQIFIVSLALAFAFLIPHLAFAAKGQLIKINNGGQHATIERTDDNSSDWYQFIITKDSAAGYIPQVGDVVTFTPVTDTARRATGVQLSGDNR